MVELYDPITGTRLPTREMISARSGHAAILLFDGSVLAVGGDAVGAGGFTSAEVYTPDGGG